MKGLMMFSHQDKFDFIEGQISSKRAWISSFGEGSKNAGPPHEADQKKAQLEILKEIRDDYEKAIKRSFGDHR